MTATEVNLALLGSVFNHLVLPLEVPGVQDSNEDAVSQEIIMRMINATNTALGLSCAAPWEGSYESLRDSLRVCNQLNRGGLERESLLKHFQELNSGRMLILYLNEQNAGLLIHRTVINDRDCVVFESFEASPIASSVLAAGRAMQWDFPGRSTRIDLTTFAEEEFQQNLASFLEKASMEGIYNLQASTRKAGVSVSEVRDTTDPALITQMLMSVLEGVGSFHQAPILRKRIRDDVNLTTGKVPWRRSPLWLILRVASQRQLYFSLGAERGQIAYKYLMAILLEKLLEDATQHLSPHLAVCLRSKLARRMAKLEMSEEKSQLQNDPTYGSWFSAVSSTVKQSIESATTKLEVAWYQLKETTTRPVPKLNGYAPSSSLDLKLNCSGKYLDEILSVKLLQSSSVGSRDLPDPLDQSIKQTQEFMGHAFHLAASEKRIEEEACKFFSPNQNHENRCLELEHQIRDIATILAIFTLWVALDRSAIKSCNLLDSLQLPTKQAMERLQIIQRYLAGRRDKSFLGNILEAPNENSIAVRFVERSESLRSLGQDIQRACNQARQEKKKEHLEMCGIYDEHTEGIANNSCRCTWEDGERVIKNCKKCFHKRLRKRMKIEVHEDFLPKKTTARYAIIFELGIPNCALTHPHRPNATNPPALHLHKCRPLKAFGDAEVGLVSLASEIKCFEQTHYKFSDGKVPVEKLYDSKLKVWCGVQIPPSLAIVLPQKRHPPTTIDGPSSYEIQANQAQVPQNISIQAFSALQKLLAGKRRRWLNLLVELSSPNLNLSDEETTRPRLPDQPLRVMTRILENILESIQVNWREHNTMQLSYGTAVLYKAREYLLQWISQLRQESGKAKTNDDAQSYAKYSLHAALLCRRTFSDLSTWLRASMAVQDNLIHDLRRLPDSLRNLLFRDGKMVYHLQDRITGAMNGSSSWAFLNEPDNHWIVIDTPGQYFVRIHFNYIHGHFLVNGKQRSKLPLEIADDEAVKWIFGDQHLLTYPSPLPGMSHRLVQTREKHQIHFGLRDSRAVIRATRYRQTWEFVPQCRLSKPGKFDLPAELILNVPKRKATRGLGGSRLVDPYSDAFNEVASIFRNFPLNAAGMLTVENQRLYSNQLNAEIDENQDAGTWYGLSSKIVLRETKTGARSIIVPLGEVTITPTYPHVDVRVRGASHYARCRIDPLLGRLTCSSEPLLIYTKALYHAITSYCLPDKLTGRTGSTEACAILQSGAAQPWEPLSEKESKVLGTFNQLIPWRQYYPPGAKRIQKCDAYRPVIEAIKERSNNLQAFTAKLNLDLTVTSHLCHRSIDQRGAYEPLLNVESNLSDTVYMRRDCQSDARAVRVHEIARVIVSRCSEMQLGGTPMSMFETSRVIGGFSAAVTDSHVACEEPLINQIEDDICENWGELVDFCRRANQFSLLFRLGLLAFNSEEYMDNIKFLAAICLIKDLRVIEPPRHQSFVAFNSRDAPSVGLLEGFISSTYPAFQEQDRWGNIAVRMNKSSIKKHEKACKQKGIELIKRILQFWPTSATDVSEILNSTANEPEESVWDVIRPEWERRLANMELSKYLERVNTFLTEFTASHPEIATPKRFPLYRSIIENWVTNPGPELQVVEDIISCFDTISNTSTEIAELSSILSRFERSHNDLPFQKGGRQLDPEIHVNFQRKLGVVYQALQQAQMDAKRIWADISAAVLARDARGLWLQLGAMSTECFHFGKGMKSALISYGTALTAVQHLVRIRYALLKKDNRSLPWKPTEVPDWLLLEIDSNILIRAEQVDVARAMINPNLGNGVLQLRKTSCIIPMTAAFLADRKKLARVVVPKALLIQTAQTMQARLGGLVGRELIQIPYSRRTPTNDNILRLYSKLHHGTLRCRGIMLTCAEHLLSYKLFGWQKYIDSEMSTADQMISFQNWLDTNCRDILDECDFTLSVKTQLNYPSGPEMPVDFHPHRWQLAQELLDLVFTHLPELQRLHTTGVQVTSKRKGRFPVIQFLKVNAENALHDLIMEDIFQGRLSLLRYFQPRSGPEQSDLREVLCEVKISEDVLSRASNLFDNPTIATNALLLLRGLILHRTLILCLGKRWNVQYGMHPDRDPIAVPFEAKGKPSDQAEYGHPDVAIIFTCLSFYYGGLTQAQLVQGVQHLLQSSDPATQYEWLISTCEDVPASLKQWNTINADDKGQMEGLWQLLRWNRVAINYYLNHFVFPIHARQFEVKLQANAWDIPIFSKDNTQVTRTSGFSGTNDNRWVLPLTINQRDLPGLKHTSAEVISYLLQERNRQFIVIPRPRLKESKEEGFLRDLKRENITVLIDMGAYISEMDNQEVARAWLEVDSEAKAVIYFRNDNRAWVHYRGNLKEDLPLLATELADDLSGCNVFLDEGHTRGVDLRLPANARGAVTLALKQTKDHTIQAAMRLRQLQTTQSLCFYGPPEVQSSIKDFCHLKNRDTIDSSHVVSWLLEQTCLCIEDLRGLYVSQGIDFCQRTDTIWRCKNFLNDESEREKLLRVLKQPERKTLKESYGPVPRISTTSIGDKLATTQLNSFMDRLALTGKNLEGRIEAGALEEVEQEREVESQVEHIRQVEKRKIYDASKFPGVNPDIMSFAETGVLEKSKRKPPGFQHAFSFVGKMAIGKRFSVHGTSSRLFVSWEFANTVKLPQHSKEADNFLRPVEWIVWSPETTTALIVIPEEAEWLLEYLRDKETVSHVHVIAYSAPVTASMIQFNNLDFYTSPTLPTGHIIPMQIRIELGILAGRLYVKEDEWVAVAEYVRGTSNDADKIAPDPASFLLEWLTIRRKTANIMHTHMGCICTGREMDHPDPSEVVEED
ncbi:hypothetical protein F5Y08DRAFT_347605 [Xylaria arbuscula]|nr:hypothetical protein F5Y08DRAFT_347605 [Xylaria arbuscula]